MGKNIIKSHFIARKLNYQSLSELIFDRLKQNGQQICIIDCELDKKWTKQQVLDSSLNFAYYLINDCKLCKGDVVCVVANNSVNHLIASIGVIMAGGVYCTISAQSTEFEMQNEFQRINPLIVVCVQSKYETIETLSKDTSIKRIISMTSHTMSSKFQCQSVEEIMNIERNGDIELPIKSDLGHIIMYRMTSGTTGRPKVVIKTNANILAAVENIEHGEIAPFTSGTTIYCWSFVYNVFLAAIIGCPQIAIYDASNDIESVFKYMHKYSITDLFVRPPQVYYLLKHYDTLRPYMSSLKRVINGCTPMSGSAYKSLIGKSDILFTFGYGNTEVGLAIQEPISQAKNMAKDYTSGRVCPNTEIKIIDEMGNSLPANISGEICIRSAQVTPGYFSNSEENAKLFTSDGFLKSGDIGYYDENNDFFIVDRIKNIVNVEGFVVIPAKLENILISHPNVTDVAVIVVRDEDRDVRIVAFVTIINDVSVDELKEYISSQVIYYKQLRGELRILDAFPLTKRGKIDKQKLKEMV